MLTEALYIAALAVVYSVILVQPGMLLGSLYQRLQDWTLQEFDLTPDAIWWLKPIISCSKCVAGQLAFWAYPFLFDYTFYYHLIFTALAIFIAALLTKLYTWTTY